METILDNPGEIMYQPSHRKENLFSTTMRGGADRGKKGQKDAMLLRKGATAERKACDFEAGKRVRMDFPMKPTRTCDF